MYQKQKGLAVGGENLAKIYAIEIKRVNLFLSGRGEKRGELKMSPTFCKSLKTNIEKMSVFRLSMMLMKTRELNRSLHYVDEKKES
jgi:hypothetical protein